MTSLGFEKKRILIWGKTYPELSSKYLETVCTGGVTAEGVPIRLYPIPYRYLQGDEQFRKYQWITARIARNYTDPRPESHEIDYDSIETGDVIETDEYEWSKRAEVLFQDSAWQFATMEELFEAQKKQKISIGVVSPREILSVDLFARPDEDGESFKDKLERLRRHVAADRAQMRLFEEFKLPELKGLEYVANRIRIHWLCHSAGCNGHKMQILDWEAIQLLRSAGDAKALQKVRDISDMKKYALRFFVSNTLAHQGAFSIVGIWYPKKSMQRTLFS